MGGKHAQLARRSILVDDEVRLSTLRASDVDELFACVERNRGRLREWMPWLDTTPSATELGLFVGSSIAEYETGPSHRLGIFIEGKIAGVVGLERIDPMHRRAAIGYWLSQEYEGRGTMTRAVKALMGYAFETLELHTLEIRAATENARSRAVAERVGMKLDGILRQREWLYDHFVDHAVYSIVASEWFAV